MRDDRIDVFSLSLRGYFESFIRVFIFTEHSDPSCSPYERRESQEGGFNSFELYIALLRLQNEIATPARPRIEQLRDQENWNRNYRSYSDFALPPHL